MITNMIGMLESGEFSDIKIIVGQEDNKKVFTAHKIVLLSTSGYFKRCCGPDSNFKEGEESTVTLPETDPRIFEMLLKCLYAGKWDDSISDEDTSKLYISADYFDMDSLKLAAARDTAHKFEEYSWRLDRRNSLITVISTMLRFYRENEKDTYLELTKRMHLKEGYEFKLLLGSDEVQKVIEQNAKLGLFFIELLLKALH